MNENTAEKDFSVEGVELEKKEVKETIGSAKGRREILFRSFKCIGGSCC